MIGQTVSHYKILEKLGGGGMGIVYKAQDLKLDRIVALKFLPPDLTRDPEAKARFIHEAKAASALQHDNICTIHDIDEAQDGQLFLSMDFYDGETLKKEIERGPLPIDEAIDLAIQISRGLAKAHEAGMVHRDIKPANIIVTKEGEAKIVDFGLAKLAGQTKLTKAGSTVGTASYMSPEQARGEESDRRSDIWSLGVVLYEMIAGRPPFKGDYENAVIYSIVNTDPEPLTGVRTGVPRELERIVLKALAKEPGQRYQHVDELGTDLGALKRELGRSGTAHFPTKRPHSSRRRLIAIAAVVVICVAAALWMIGERGDSGLRYERSKSIGVLPFVPLNKTPDDLSFADGIHDDILTQLSKISELRVIARTSMVLYRDTKKRMNEIGDELDVGYLLEGSVRRAGGKLKISAQLIDTKTEGHVWADDYERNESDIFAVQTEISKRIAEELHLRLLPSEKASIETPMTSNLAARDYYVKGQYYWANYLDSSGNAKAAEMFDSAAFHDPKFVEAHAWACVVHSMMYDSDLNWDHSPARLEKSKQTLARAVAIAPDIPEVRLAKAHYYRHVEHDKSKALKEFEAVLKVRPSESTVLDALGGLYQELGDLQKAREVLRRRRIVDPATMSGGWESFQISSRLREWDVAKREAEEYLAGHPDDPLAYGWLSDIFINGFGDLKGARTILNEGTRRPPSVFRGGQYVSRQFFWRVEYFERKYDSALACASAKGSYFAPEGVHQVLAATFRARGDLRMARAYNDSVRIVLEKRIQGGDTYVWTKAALGSSLAGLGRYDEAIRLAKEAVATTSQGPKIDLFNKPGYEGNLLEIYVLAGRQKEAIDLVEDLLKRPGPLTVWQLRLDPLYDPLRNDARFQKLVAE
jgi:non-specific serine/threonine protein kinase